MKEDVWAGAVQPARGAGHRYAQGPGTRRPDAQPQGCSPWTARTRASLPDPGGGVEEDLAR
ncbi:hypothetical protein ACN9M0_00980 [Streptomyces sp. R-07]|uniref:hypothetical protein n=1 Tax=Streptomyces sp. R-07 TaxID=3404052 RepID=UPI003CF7E367